MKKLDKEKINLVIDRGVDDHLGKKMISFWASVRNTKGNMVGVLGL
jgi:hypothetical protein